MKIFKICFIALTFLMVYSCNPDEDDKLDIGTAPQNITFDIVPTSNPNYFNLVNTTSGTFIHQWDLGNGSLAEGDEVEAYYPRAGTFEITLTAFNQGGFGTSTASVTVTRNDPDACNETVRKLSDCGSKSWVLEPAEGAMVVGPDDVTVWWSNSAADVTARTCHFNDEYIFSEDGTFEYQNNGDFWADTDANGNILPADLGVSPGCQPSTALPDKYKVWGSGLHNYNTTSTTLTVVGEGAWIGLYKVGTDGEVETPQQSVTFQILELTDDRMVIAAVYSWGQWKFTLVPKP